MPPNKASTKPHTEKENSFHGANKKTNPVKVITIKTASLWVKRVPKMILIRVVHNGCEYSKNTVIETDKPKKIGVNCPI